MQTRPGATECPCKRGNRLKIGLFGANCSSGRAVTMVPERWSGDWRDKLRLAHMADEAGIDFMLPIGRWKGYGGDTDYQGATLETLTWATGLLAATKRITVFGTVHAPLFHPLIAAKEFVTADHIGEGPLRPQRRRRLERGRVRDVRRRAARSRAALRLCAGMDRRRSSSRLARQRGFRLRGPVSQAQGRARQAEAVWRHAADDHECRRLADRPRLRDAQLRRLLHAGRRACRSRRPREKVAAASRTQARSMAARSTSIRSASSPAGRPCRKREDYYHHAVIDSADWTAVDGILALKNISPRDRADGRIRHQAQAICEWHGRPADHRRSGPRGAATGRSQLAPVSPALPCRSSTTATNCRTSATKCCRGSSGRDCARIGDPSTAVCVPHLALF